MSRVEFDLIQQNFLFHWQYIGGIALLISSYRIQCNILFLGAEYVIAAVVVAGFERKILEVIRSSFNRKQGFLLSFFSAIIFAVTKSSKRNQ